jgi:hypothetical protein
MYIYVCVACVFSISFYQNEGQQIAVTQKKAAIIELKKVRDSNNKNETQTGACSPVPFPVPSPAAPPGSCIPSYTSCYYTL